MVLRELKPETLATAQI